MARAANGRRVRLAETRIYRFQQTLDQQAPDRQHSNGNTRAKLVAPVTVTGGANTTVRGTAENGLRNGVYRGRIVLSRDGRAVLVVNSVGVEQYLYGVVPSEMPASWPAEALKAQAVVARSYALRGRRPGEPYDVFADVRSQVYRGVLAETDATNAAVKATRAGVVMAGGQIAQTFFFSTSGRAHGHQRGGVRRHADLLPALGRRPARRPLALPRLDRALHGRATPASASLGHARRRCRA